MILNLENLGWDQLKIHPVPIGVLYSVQYRVQYSLELRMRNNLQAAVGGVVFFRKQKLVQKALCMASALSGVQ